MKNKIGLVILDGWGIGDGSSSDAIAQARTPFMEELLRSYPNATLTTHGEAVGLPEGQMGNSEVGHLNIGAGRIVYQELTRINKAISDGDFFKNTTLLDAFQRALKNNRKVHFIGLVSNGGVHSAQNHLHALCEMAKDANIPSDKLFIHAFTDGRDCDPKSALGFIETLEKTLLKTGGTIASIIGRYYAMDRDNRWERIKKAYDLLVHGVGTHYPTAKDAIISNYEQNISDEFMEPCLINKNGTIENEDVVVCFNFRTDRPREISLALTQKPFPDFNMYPLKVHYCTMTSYDDSYNNVHVVFEKDNLSNTLGEILAKNKIHQVRIAETEKYPHVTFFFNGGRELPFEKEARILIDSPKVATYDLKPEMSALEVQKGIIEHLQAKSPSFFCLNFANPDMVGHTGVFPAIVKAVETVDSCLSKIVSEGLSLGYEFLILADHGNADYAVNSDGSPNTAHSLNPVPVIFVSKNKQFKVASGILADVAPTILDRLNIPQPMEMTGNSLLK